MMQSTMNAHSLGLGKGTSSHRGESFPWHLGVFDAHCHPTDTVPSMDRIMGMRTRALTIMATRGEDQDIVAAFADSLGVTRDSLAMLQSKEPVDKALGQLIPCFGWHPWFSHQIYDDLPHDQESKPSLPNKIEHYKRVFSPVPTNDDDFIFSLPDPRPLSALIGQTRKYLERYPYSLIGEIGLDRAFRIPVTELSDNGYERDQTLTPGGREGRRLSPYHVDMDHQRKILKAQLNLAGEMQRAVSVHGVAAHGVVFETLQETWRGHEKPVLSRRERRRKASVDKVQCDQNLPGEHSSDGGNSMPFPPRICLHSYSGPPDTLRQYLHPSIPAVIYFSFSYLVNFSSPASKKAINVIKAVPHDRILTESDLHAAGEKMDDLMEEVVRIICQIKEWSLEEGVKQLASNWVNYVFGDSP